MLIINRQPLRVGEASVQGNPLYWQAKEYSDGLRYLKENYKDGKITFTRTGFPKYTDAIDPKGRDMKDVVVPTTPARFPLSTYYASPKRGKELWECCTGEPEISAGGLWGIGNKGKRSFSVTDRLVVDINDDPDFAYFLYYLSRAVKGGHLKVEDVKLDAKQRGDKRREALERETAIWQTLADENLLRKIAQSRGIEGVDKKEPDIIRFELETLLKTNDEGKKRDPSLKGTKEFLEELKITDYTRLSAFIRHWLDKGMITYKPDGRYRVGDKIIAQVPTESILQKFQWLCNYYAAPNQVDKLRELFHDLINKEYLDSLVDEKDFRWIAKVENIQGYFNKNAEEVEEMVYAEFNITSPEVEIQENIANNESTNDTSNGSDIETVTAPKVEVKAPKVVKKTGGRPAKKK